MPALPSFSSPSDDAFDHLLDDCSRLYMTAPAQALATAGRALASLGVPPDPARAARALQARGLAQHHCGRHAEGSADLRQALDVAPPGDLRLRAQMLRGLSQGSELLGALDDALAWALQALDAAHRHGDPLLIADVLLSVGVACSRCGDVAGGLAHYEQVLAHFESVGDTRRCVRVLNNMAINCKNLGRHDESAAHFQRALAMAGTLGDDGMRAVLRSNLGETLWRQGRLDEACQVLRAALADLGPGGYVGGEINAHVTLGRVLLARGDAGAAQAELERALELARASGNRNYTALAHQTLAELHKAAGRFDLALAHHEDFHAAERLQFNEDSDRKLTALRVQLEVAEARHEAEVQRLKRVELAHAHAQLQALHAALLAADEEKSRLLVRLDAQSRTDALTGLANRRQLDERLAEELARAQRNGHPLSVAMCDLDDFKRINDRFGHAVGDAVLRQVGQLLRERCRGTDLVARYGGEEFCIAFLDSDAAHAASACEALRSAVAAHDWQALHPQLQVTLSIGLAQAAPAGEHHALLSEADTCLYRAKHDGKNRVHA